MHTEEASRIEEVKKMPGKRIEILKTCVFISVIMAVSLFGYLCCIDYSESGLLQNGSDSPMIAVHDESLMPDQPEDGMFRKELPTKEEIDELNAYVNPVRLMIEDLKSKNCSDEEITEELKKHGYGWYPETGACWVGTPPSDEQLEIIREIRGPDYSPFPSRLSTNSSEEEAGV